MKSVLLSILISLFFFVSCDKKEYKTDADMGSEGGKCYPAGTCDEGLVCENGTCVNETTDEEETDEDADDGETTDDPTDPCNPNPCTMTGSDGECTVDGESYACGCETNYTWDEDNKKCEADKRTVNCTNEIPYNASYSGDNADGTIEQTWSGSEWRPGTDTCEWECNAGYDKENDDCINSKMVDCASDEDKPENSVDVVEEVEITYTEENGWSDPGKCEWECDTDYFEEEGACINSKMVDCLSNDAKPSNSVDVVVQVEVTYTTDGGWSDPAVCGWECDTNYTESDGSCVADIREADCTNIPANATGTGDNSEGKITQTWSGTAWQPADDTCTWECDTNFTKDGELCVADTAVAACTNSLPDYAGWSDDNPDGEITQTWSGTEWLPATDSCTWECNENFSESGGACVADTRRTDCTETLPAHGIFTGENDDGKFEQTWSYYYTEWKWIPETYACEWDCEGNYDREGDVCVVGTRRVACENIPENGEGINTNSDGMFEQTWDEVEETWLPATFECDWSCKVNYTYSVETEICEADTQRVACTNDVPINASYSGDNEDGMFEQTWSGDEEAWLPATFECDWDCDKCFVLNEISGECVDLSTVQQTVYVDINAVGVEDGTSWTDAYIDLSVAISEVCDGQDIWVAAGTYIPTGCPHRFEEDCENDDRFKHFTMETNVGIYGGFAGDELEDHDLSLRDFITNPTILSGDINGDDMWDDINKEWLNRDDNILNLIFISYEKGVENSVLDGFTVKGGYARDGFMGNYNGGGILLGKDNKLTVRNCNFIGNTASQGGAIDASTAELVVENTIFEKNSATYDGGAINLSGTPLTVTNTDFIGNTASRGGAIDASTAELVVENTVFEKNSATYDGGAINLSETPLTVTNTDFIENYGSRGVAINSHTNGSIILSETGFYNNIGVSQGAVNISAGEIYVSDSVFQGNISESGEEWGSSGGAISISGSVMEIYRTLFLENSADSGSVLSIGDFSTAYIDTSEFRDNQGVSGGAVNSHDNSNIEVVNSIFSGNTASTDMYPCGEYMCSGGGGAISLSLGEISITGTTFYQNSARHGASVVISGAVFEIDSCEFIQNSNGGNSETSGNVAIRDSTGTVSSTLFIDGTGIALSAKESDIIVENCVFNGNVSTNAGALESQMSNILITGSTFTGNQATLEGDGMVGFAGAVFINAMDDEVGIIPGYSATIINSVFKDNFANMVGGAVFIIGTDSEITNCTFDGNAGGMMSEGLMYGQVTGTINNSVITDGVNQITTEFSGAGIVFDPSVITVNYSDIIGSGGSGNDCGAGGTDPCWTHWTTDGGNNIDADPVFMGEVVNPEHPLTLDFGSPCIDTGNNTFVDGIVTDVIGAPRIINGTVDMGAYEFGSYNTTTVHYFTGWATPYIHYDNGSVWTVSPGVLMTTDGTWAEITVGWTGAQIEFVFNDGGSIWDNNSSANYFTSESEIWLKEGMIYTYDPE